MQDLVISDMYNSLVKDGYTGFSNLFDPVAAKNLLDAVMSTRRFDSSLFLSEQEWEASPKTHKNTNPGPGFNVLEKFPEKLDFVEKNEHFCRLLNELLGKNYRILTKKLVCRLSWSKVPDWLQHHVRGNPCNTFGAYMRPEYRDITYFLDNDLHQDVQDVARMPPATREHRYITLYVYLDDVTESDAPVHLLPGTHVLGATPFQHDVRYESDKDKWLYTSSTGENIESRMLKLTGKGGHAGLWHSCLVHGAPPVKEGHLRISLRYLIGCGANTENCGLDEINKHIRGPLYLNEDFTPGSRANYDGSWNLRMTDFIRIGYKNANLEC